MVPKVDADCLASLNASLQKYFDMMHTCDTRCFDDVFLPSVYLHGFRDGRMVSWSAEAYKEVLANRRSPASQNASRLDEVLLMDFASPTQALTKVRVKISDLVFVDYLTWHNVDGRWLISSKGFHLEASGMPIS